MPTNWGNLFTGYDFYGDTFTAYPNLYTQAANGNNLFDLFHQFILHLPYDLNFLFGVFYSSLVPLTLIAALFFMIFMPILKRPQRW